MFVPLPLARPLLPRPPLPPRPFCPPRPPRSSRPPRPLRPLRPLNAAYTTLFIKEINSSFYKTKINVTYARYKLKYNIVLIR